MRDIKFRAWHQQGLSKPEDNKHSMTYWKLGQGLDTSWFYAHAKDVMQYTGLKDKNGVEIYEGDRLRDSNGFAGTVVWWRSGFFCEVSDGGGKWNILSSPKAEVIGNIYESPELLTKEGK